VLFNIRALTFALKANHNKDYSVVKTSKAAQVAFFIYVLNCSQPSAAFPKK